ncbi:MAG: MFS transporter [Alphaproteobacteria bacterium]
MLKNILASIAALLLGVFFVTVGIGLLNTSLSVKMEQAGLVVTVSGLVQSCYFIGLTLGSMYSYKIIGRVGYIRSFAAFASLVSAVTLIHGFRVEPYSWAGLRFVEGFSIAGLLTCIESWLNVVAENKTRGLILSFYMITYYIGIAVGQYLLTTPDSSGFTFYIMSSILLSISLVPIVLTKVSAPDISSPDPLPFKKLWKISPIGVMGCISCGLTTGAFYSLGATFAYSSGLSLNQTSYFMLATVCGGFLLQWPIGKISDYKDRRIILIIISVLVAIISFALILIGVNNFATLLWLLVLFGGTLFCVYPVSISYANDFIKKEESVSASGGLMLAYSVGAIGGPIIASLFMRYLGNNGFFWHMAITSLGFAGLCFYRMYYAKRTPDDTTAFYALPQYTTPVMSELDPRSDAVIDNVETSSTKELDKEELVSAKSLDDNEGNNESNNNDALDTNSSKIELQEKKSSTKKNKKPKTKKPQNKSSSKKTRKKLTKK